MTAAISQEILAQFAQFQEFLASQESGVIVEAEPKKAPAKKARANGKPAAKIATPAKRKPAQKKRTCNITAGEAWKALGGDPEFQPANLDKSASGPMLWRLNDQGLLTDLLA